MDRPIARSQSGRFRRRISNLANAPAFPCCSATPSSGSRVHRMASCAELGPWSCPAGNRARGVADAWPVPVVKSGDRAVARLSLPGLYLVEAGGARGVIGVNVGDPDVSNLSRSVAGQ
jgi:hypothetical protein